VALALAASFAPVYCLAGDSPGPPPSTKTLAQSVQKAVEYEVSKTVKATVPAAARQDSPASRSSASFFKTRTGVITLVAIAAGAGYALYSTSNDRVKSPNRQYGGNR
jgi:hypothetical protein